MIASGQLRRVLVRTAITFLLLAGLVLAVHHFPHIDEQGMADAVRDRGAIGLGLLLGMTAIGSAVGVPRQGFSFAAGYVYGPLAGLLAATVGTTLGCAFGFWVTRLLGKPFMPLRLAGSMARLDRVLAASPFVMTLIVRLLPVGSNAVTNIVAGMSSIPAGSFIAASCLGYIPQNFIFALLGSGLRVDPFWRTVLAVLLFAVSMGLGLVLYRRYRRTLHQEA